MNKEYTYSMPDSFMKDQSVPARWRVLGIINGFAIAGKPCYASNEWFSKELSCSIHTVSNAFSELEEKGEIYCVRTKRTRVAYRIKPEMETNFHLRWKPTEHSDSNQLNTISDSISDTNTGASEDGRRVVEVPTFKGEDDSVLPTKKPPKYPNAKTVFSWFPRPEPSWKINTTQQKHAELLFERGEEKVRNILRYVEEHKDDDNFYQVHTPYDLETKWVKIAAYAKRNS